MRTKVQKAIVLFGAFFFAALMSHGQNKGSLFIIGGGERTPALMKELVKTADLRQTDYVVVLPMATSIPEESIAYFSSQLKAVCNNPITSFNFNKAQADANQSWIDSIKNAKLIYITGGDQNKFMAVVSGTKLYGALHQAFRNGATISGTSAGAAVMSQVMLTGEERDKSSKNGFQEIKKNNTVTASGMGFITKAIIDQHFIKRSRYNRLLGLLGDHPEKTLIGIDESTAIIVKKNRAEVVGESQVVVVSRPKKLKVFSTDKIAFKNARLSLFSAGDQFKIK